MQYVYLSTTYFLVSEYLYIGMVKAVKNVWKRLSDIFCASLRNLILSFLEIQSENKRSW